jgi:ribosomal protein S18 acetylase RimI-like enzyme
MDIRAVERADLDQLVAMDLDFETEKVWQLDSGRSEGSPGALFRVARLPRPMKVAYPRNPANIETSWSNYLAIFAAVENNLIQGYIALSNTQSPGIVWVTDGGVNHLQRRKGIGSALLLHAQRWAMQQQHKQMSLSIQSKNYPAIQLVQRLGYEFSGYNDHYFDNGDIALFFSKELGN